MHASNWLGGEEEAGVRNPIRHSIATALSILIVTSLVLGVSPMVSAKKQNHCVNPAGIDLNAFYGTNDAFITPFCTVARTGDKWRPMVRWLVGDTHELIPADYVPARPTPLEDFLSKLISVRYVIDEGTKRERTYVFEANELIVVPTDLPDNSAFVTFTPRLKPLRPGEHSIDIYINMAAEHWDGLGLEADEHSAPAGESAAPSVEFRVVNKKAK